MKLILVGFLLILPSFALADKSCFEFTDDKLRLLCYDRLYDYQKPNSVKNVKYTGDWVYVEKIDAFTDKNASYLYLDSEYIGRKGDDFPESLVIRCKGKGHDAYIISDGYIGGDYSNVRYRFGSKQMRSERWSLSTDGEAIFAPYTGNSFGLERLTNFIKEIRTGEDFIFELSDYNGTKNSASFDNSIHPKLDFVLNGCKEP